MNRRLRTMLRVDFRRMFTSSRVYVMTAIALLMPILILVMTSSLAGTAVTEPQTGVETTVQPFTSAWQVIASESGAGMDMTAMDMTSMCNINLMYFMLGVFVCLFVGEDFQSGYAKNLFTVRAKKMDYVISKTLSGFVAGAMFLMAFFVGTVLGGAVAGLSFDLGAAGAGGLLMCMLAKIFLMLVFTAIFLAMSCIGKRRVWLSVLLSMFAGMLLFMMIPMLSPLDSGLMNVFMCLAGGAIFAAGIGAISNLALSRTGLV